MNNAFQSGRCETAVVQTGIFEGHTAFTAVRADEALGWELNLPEQPNDFNEGYAVSLS